MKKILVLLLFITSIANAQIRINEKEYFTASMSVDPNASIKENGLGVVLEIGYVGNIYAKAGIEYFPTLYPEYFDVHGGLGLNVMISDVRTYYGIRLGRIFRENKSRGDLFGLEAGIDYSVSDRVFIGIRVTRDYRNDGIALGWDAYWRNSGFIRIGYQWDWKGN